MQPLSVKKCRFQPVHQSASHLWHLELQLVWGGGDRVGGAEGKPDWRARRGERREEEGRQEGEDGRGKERKRGGMHMCA